MRVLKLNARQRADLAETLRELANLAAGALVLGQWVTAQPVSWRLIGGGLVLWVALVCLALVLPKDE